MFDRDAHLRRLRRREDRAWRRHRDALRRYRVAAAVLQVMKERGSLVGVRNAMDRLRPVSAALGAVALRLMRARISLALTQAEFCDDAPAAAEAPRAVAVDLFAMTGS